MEHNDDRLTTNPDSIGAWARDFLDRPPPLPGSVQHRELTSALEHSTANFVALRANYIALATKLKYAGLAIMQQRAILAPIRRIPPEILSHIFRLVLEECSTYSYSLGDHWRQLVKITAVCRRWRAAALNTPRLWAWYQATQQLTEQYLASSQCWLARSGNVPLNVELSYCGDRSTLAHLSSVVLQRIANIQIIFEDQLDLEPLFRFLGEAPQLRTLYLHLSNCQSRQIGRLPFLQTLNLQYFNGIPRLECPSLVFLELFEVTYSSDDFKAIANAAPMLKSVLITACSRPDEQDGDGNEGDILLPSLLKLELDTEDDFYLDFIHSENLQQLTVQLHSLDCHSIPFPPLKRLLKLDMNLWLHGNDIEDVVASVVSWLYQARQVKELMIRIEPYAVPWNDNDFNELISCILAYIVHCNMCPLLRAITVPNCSLDSLDIIPEFKKQRYALHRLSPSPFEAYYVARGWGS